MNNPTHKHMLPLPQATAPETQPVAHGGTQFLRLWVERGVRDKGRLCRGTMASTLLLSSTKDQRQGEASV